MDRHLPKVTTPAPLRCSHPPWLGSTGACVRGPDSYVRVGPDSYLRLASPVRLSGEGSLHLSRGVALNLGVCIASGWGGTLLDMAFIDDVGAPFPRPGWLRGL